VLRRVHRVIFRKDYECRSSEGHPCDRSCGRRPINPRPANLLLAALPLDIFRALSPQLTLVPIPLKHVLHQSGERLGYVYFLNSGVASITTRLSDGRPVDAATVGDEGMLGVEAFLGDHAIA
jgi:CRP-like cAMP-binding protein